MREDAVFKTDIQFSLYLIAVINWCWNKGYLSQLNLKLKYRGRILVCQHILFDLSLEIMHREWERRFM